MLYRQRDAFGLSLLSDKIDYISDIKSNFAHKRYIYSLLENLLTDKPKEKILQTNIAPLLHQLAEQIHKRSLVIIFTDLLSTKDTEEDIIKSLQHLRYNKHEVLLFHCTDKQTEEELLYKNRPYRFRDVETKEEVKINPADIREEYQKQVTQRFKKIQDACLGMRIDCVNCDINLSLDQVLLPYFYKRIRLK